MRLHVHRVGSGPPLVLVHGIGHHWQTWRPVIGLLAGEFDVLAVDSPGFGRSPPLPPGVRLTIPAYADAFARCFSELGLGRPHVAGNSMGGAIALELARRRAVATATAFSPAGFWTDLERRWTQALIGTLLAIPGPARPAVLRALRTRWGRRLLAPTLVGRPARLPGDEAVATFEDAWRAPAMPGALEAFDAYRFGRGDELRGVPVTVAWGNRDVLLPYHLQAPRARAALPWARHVTLGAGHVPFSDDPAACAEVIRARASAGRHASHEAARLLHAGSERVVARAEQHPPAPSR